MLTEQEALYWKRYIDRVLTEKLNSLTVTEVEAARIREFADSYMGSVTGQQLLPQSVFRRFLEIFSGIPQMQEELAQAQQEIHDAVLGGCTEKEMEQTLDGLMWDDEWMWLPSMDIDEEGFVALNIEIDEDGWAHFVDD